MAKRPPDQTPGQPDQPPSGDQEPAAPTDDNAPSVHELANLLRTVVEAGIDHATAADLRAMFDLSCVRDRAHGTSDDELTAAARDVIRDALAALGGGNFGRAARLLFGATDDTRGQPARERRRLAAYQIDVMPDWFRRRYVPQIVADTATEVLKIERAGTPDEASAATGAAVVRIRDGPRARTEDATAADAEETPVALTGGPRAVTPVGQLQRVLQGLRDQQTRKEWHLVWLVGGGLVFIRWGLDAVPRYVLVVAVLAAGKTAADMVLLWRATRSLALGDLWPRLILRLGVAVVVGGFVVGQDDNDYARGCENPDNLVNCPEEGPLGSEDTPTSTIPYVPLPYAVPHESVAPECPPADTTQRRLAFTTVPPLCIDPTRDYVAHFDTSYGSFDMLLNTQRAQWTVNNFVYLARWNYYDGVHLTDWPRIRQIPNFGDIRLTGDYLVLDGPVSDEDAEQVPGYGLTFDNGPFDYPNDNNVVYAVATDAASPDRFSFVVSPEAHRSIAEDFGGAYPLLGQVVTCPDIITDSLRGGRQPRIHFAAPLVIRDITITEHDRGTVTIPRSDLDQHCRENQAGLPQPEDLNPNDDGD